MACSHTLQGSITITRGLSQQVKADSDVIGLRGKNSKGAASIKMFEPSDSMTIDLMSRNIQKDSLLYRSPQPRGHKRPRQRGYLP